MSRQHQFINLCRFPICIVGTGKIIEPSIDYPGWGVHSEYFYEVSTTEDLFGVKTRCFSHPELPPVEEGKTFVIPISVYRSIAGITSRHDVVYYKSQIPSKNNNNGHTKNILFFVRDTENIIDSNLKLPDDVHTFKNLIDKTVVFQNGKTYPPGPMSNTKHIIKTVLLEGVAQQSWICRVRYDHDLPPVEEGVTYIVSQSVFEALDRQDLAYVVGKVDSESLYVDTLYIK